jgi:hypothetical protein
VFYANNDPRAITGAKFVAQTGASLAMAKLGGSFEKKMSETSYFSWKMYQGAMRIGVPRTAHAALGASIRFGQNYGVPLTNNLAGSLSSSAAGTGADAVAPPPTPVPTPAPTGSPASK